MHPNKCLSRNHPKRFAIERLESRLLLCNNVGGTYDTDQVWSDTSQPYCLVGSVVVAGTATLSIMPGVRVVTPDASKGILVSGGLVASGAIFTGPTDIVARAGSNLQLTNATTVEGNQVLFESGSNGSVTDSTFSTAKLKVLSGNVSSIEGNTFLNNSPVFVIPSQVPRFYGTNSYVGNTKLKVQGDMLADAIWEPHPNVISHDLVFDVNVGVGFHLEFRPGVVVTTSSSQAEIYVDGSLTADGVHFSSVSDEVIVRMTGRFDLSNSTITGRVTYAEGASGSIVGNTFDKMTLRMLSPNVADISGNLFEQVYPITTTPSLVPRFYGSNSFLVPAVISVEGEMTSDAVWQPHPNILRYDLVEDTYVNAGYQLDIQSGVVIRNNDVFNSLFIDGVVLATGVSFTGTEIDISVRAGGTLQLSHSTVAGDTVSYEQGSFGSVTDSRFTTARLQLLSTEVSAIERNELVAVAATPSLVHMFHGSNSYPTPGNIFIRGTMHADATWLPFPNLNSYYIYQNVYIGHDYQLDIAPGLLVRGHTRPKLFVDGRVNASGVSIEVPDIFVRTGGTLNLDNSTMAGTQIVSPRRN